MPTSNYGGQGAPNYNKGKFTVKYTERAEGAAPEEKAKNFLRYDEAEAFYNSIDDDAFLWDYTRSAELCEGKTYVA